MRFALAFALAAAASAANPQLRVGNSVPRQQAVLAAEDEAKPMSLLQVGTKWRFGSNYVPQHYGSWKFSKGTWNFGNDKRIECEACGYVTYMLIDRLGDNFNAQKVQENMQGLCQNDVQ